MKQPIFWVLIFPLITLVISELLINNGTDLNAKNVDGKTPLDYAIENNHTNIADLLRQHGGKTGKELEAKKRHIGWQRSR